MLQVQLRLQQVVSAPSDKKEDLLKELEHFAFRGIPNVNSPRAAAPPSGGGGGGSTNQLTADGDDQGGDGGNRGWREGEKRVRHAEESPHQVGVLIQKDLSPIYPFTILEPHSPLIGELY